MATNLTNYFAGKLRDLYFRGVAYSGPSTLYVALFTVAPGPAGGGTEVAGGSYARVGIAVSTSAWTAGAAGATANNAAVTFATPSADWGTVTHYALFDASTGGNMLVWAALSASRPVYSGDAPSFAIGAISGAFA